MAEVITFRMKSEKSYLRFSLATRSRSYTDKTRLRGLKSLNLLLVRAGGLSVCSREFHSFQTSSYSYGQMFQGT
jgi:hypothetical protein